MTNWTYLPLGLKDQPGGLEEQLVQLVKDVGAADKAAIQLVRLRISSAEVKSSRIPPQADLSSSGGSILCKRARG